MIEELRKDYKKRLIKKDQEETDKIFNAIHEQAYWKRLDDENKRILKNIEKQEQQHKLEQKRAKRKEFKDRLIEDSINFALFVMIAIPTVLLLVVLCY